jgi:short-subunit dehydrogenase
MREINVDDIINRGYAVITGATGGLGTEYALQLSSLGYDLLLTSRDDDELTILKNKLQKIRNVKIKTISADLSIDADVEKLIKMIKKTNVSMLINNAGFGIHDYFHETDAELIDEMIKVHNMTPVKLISAVLPQFIRNKKGMIINVSSFSAFFPLKKGALYDSTKAFLVIFSESLHMELKDKGIKVQVLCPGFTKTGFFENRRGKNKNCKKQKCVVWQSPEEVVRKSIKDLKKKNKVVSIPGFHNRMLLFAKALMPRKVYYLLMGWQN